MVIISGLCAVGAPSCQTGSFVLGELESAASGGTGDAGGATSTGGSGVVEECSELAANCDDDAECCSSFCFDGACDIRVPGCASLEQPCSTALDCCSLSCADGACASLCVSDELPCDEDDTCCSGSCVDGSCEALNDACLTSGNECEESSVCCSGLCVEGRCSAASSFCSQEGDVCAQDSNCCSFGCDVAEGAVLGTCSAPPNAPSNCADGIAGTICGDCNDCCSRLCVPYGNHGMSVCALAKGCRQCCGGDPDSGLPGAGNVTCNKGADDDWGVCRNAMACSPQGNVCHIQNYACGVSAAANRCCGAEGEEGVCLLDADGVPRCNGLGSSCQPAGETCAIDDDCCAGACLPDAAGGLTCRAAGSCVGVGAGCTTSSECCPGSSCIRSADTVFGVCSDENALNCSLFGQLCGDGALPCCGQNVCFSGRCAMSSEP